MTAGLIDTHCHLDRFPPEERAALLARAAEAGLAGLVTIATAWSASDALVEIARAPNPLPVRCTIGIHPAHVDDEPPVDPRALAAYARAHPEVVGIGESGLDHVVATADRTRQETSFRAHVEAARLADLPLVIHARGADADIARVLADEHRAAPFRFVLHCFSSGAALAELGVALGGHVSFSGILTFPRSGELRDIAARIPPDRLLVETDAPYLAPVPHRGRPNEPAHVVHTARVLAETIGLAPEALAALTTANARSLFALPA